LNNVQDYIFLPQGGSMS